MTRIEWESNLPRLDRGCDQGVLYLDEDVVPWNGLVQVTENDSATVAANAYDGRNVRIVENIGNFSAQIDALTYPREFDSYAGLDFRVDRQRRKRFGLSYRTGFDDQRQIHMVWNALALPVVRSRVTQDTLPHLETLQWTLQATPETIPGAAPGAHLMVDYSNVLYVEAWDELNDILYGTSTTSPRLPTPTEVVELFESFVMFRVTYNGDGTWTAEGPDDWITVNEDGTYEISSPTAFQLDDDTYTLSSY